MKPWHKTDFTDIRVLVLWNLASGSISVGKACDVLNGGDTEMPMSAEQASDYYGGYPVRTKKQRCTACGGLRSNDAQEALRCEC